MDYNKILTWFVLITIIAWLYKDFHDRLQCRRCKKYVDKSFSVSLNTVKSICTPECMPEDITVRLEETNGYETLKINESGEIYTVQTGQYNYPPGFWPRRYNTPIPEKIFYRSMWRDKNSKVRDFYVDGTGVEARPPPPPSRTPS